MTLQPDRNVDESSLNFSPTNIFNLLLARREYHDQFVMGAYCFVDSSSWRDVSSCTDAVKFIRDHSRCSANKSVISMEIHPVHAGISSKYKNQ
jgi:hypothetical protein